MTPTALFERDRSLQDLLSFRLKELDGSSISLSGNLQPIVSLRRAILFLNFSEDRNSLLATPSF